MGETHIKAERAKLTEGVVYKQIIGMTIPMTVGLFSVIAFNLVDTFFVGQLSTSHLAAMSFTFPVVMVLSSLALGLGIGGASVISRAIGEGKRREVQRLTTDLLVLSILVVLFFVVIGLLTIDPLFRLLGAKDELLPLIKDYMYIWYVGMPFLVIPMVGNSAIRATGDATFPAMIMVISAIVNCVFDPLLIFGLAGFPRMELQGAAIATVILEHLLFLLHFTFFMLEKR